MTTEEWDEILSNGSIWGCGHEEQAPHTCPYKVDIEGDHNILCKCCESCERECYLDT